PRPATSEHSLAQAADGPLFGGIAVDDGPEDLFRFALPVPLRCQTEQHGEVAPIKGTPLVIGGFEGQLPLGLGGAAQIQPAEGASLEGMPNELQLGPMLLAEGS